MMNEELHMKHLKIDANKGLYSIDGASWNEIDRIGKDDLLKLVDLALGEEFEMDAYNKDNLPNPAHEIVYRNLHAKLADLQARKERFKDESQQLYRDAIRKYQE